MLIYGFRGGRVIFSGLCGGRDIFGLCGGCDVDNGFCGGRSINIVWGFCGGRFILFEGVMWIKSGISSVGF